MVKACQELMTFNDLVAISFYPFFITETPDVAFKWLLETFDQFGKPYAMVETNDTAEVRCCGWLRSACRSPDGTP